MFDSRRKERVGEEKGHQLHTPENFQQPGYTCQTKYISAKKNRGKKEDEDVPDGIPLKPVHHKRTVNPRPGHTEDRGNRGENSSKPPVEVPSQHRKHLMYGAAEGSRHPKRDLDWLPDEQWRMAKEIHKKELLLQEKLLRTEQRMRKMILEDSESSETWSGEPGGRRDVDTRTEEGVSNRHEGKRDTWNTLEGKQTRSLPKRPGRAEEPSDHRQGTSGHLNRRGREGTEVKELNSDTERSKRSIHLSAKMRGESQWGRAPANEEQHKLSKEKAPGKRWERNSTGRHGSSVEETEHVSQQRSVHVRMAEPQGGKERPYVPRSSRPQVADQIPEEKTDASFQLLLCKHCKRRFASERLENHLAICERLHRSERKVYDTAKHRLKGTDLKKFWPIDGAGVRSEVLKSTGGQVKQGSSKNTHQVGQSVQNSPDRVACPHCSRLFAPRPAERHIPKCQNIRSRPPAPRYRQ
ncbi:hypothetical protein NHX12_019283 [Muraenolepis orangiensis]|uniref:C2HC/C3H-type domain-containing protein n=1 Tax=Muraenolepis orangiensis TaxID=630683 RepID=A0A9Q0ESW9_9TELE|nr:hypothetical protein NHX12_019283 [Muraenolepis orangiensis]